MAKQITLEELNEAIEREYADGAPDAGWCPDSLYNLDERDDMKYSIELLETGSVTLRLGQKAYVVSLTITEE